MGGVGLTGVIAVTLLILMSMNASGSPSPSPPRTYHWILNYIVFTCLIFRKLQEMLHISAYYRRSRYGDDGDDDDLNDDSGWVDGHAHVPAEDVTFGGLQSFLIHANNKAKASGCDLLVFDTGDLTEGTGISDSSLIHGQYIFDGNY